MNHPSLLRLFSLLTVLCGITGAQAADETIIETVAATTDVTLRSGGNKADTAFPSLAALEMKNSTDDRMVALMTFTLPEKPGYVLQSASLRLVTERAKGTMDVYPFTADVTNADTWNSQKDNVTATLAQEKLISVKLAGTDNKAVTDAGASATLTDWVNTLDVTTAAQQASGTLALLMACETSTSIKIYSSDATDVTNTKVTPNFTFAAADLKPVLTLTYAPDPDYGTSAQQPTADTWLREGNTTVRGSETTMELCNYTNTSDASKNKNFLGLLAFELPADAVNAFEVESATLRLVSERVKGKSAVKVYGYPAAFDETTIYSKESDRVAAALATDPITTFEAKGASTAMGSDQLADAYKTADAWTTEIDLTSYVKSVASEGAFAVLLQKSDNEDKSTKFYTREATDVTNSKDASVTFAAADLKPLLTLTYRRRATESVTTTESAQIADVGHIATFYQTYATTIPEGATCYYALTASDNQLNMIAVEGDVLPAKTGVLVVTSEATTLSFAPAKTAPAAIDGNLLSGTAEALSVEANSVMTLGKGSTSQTYGFYSFTGTTIKPHRAYIEKSKLPSGESAKALTMRFPFDDEDATAITTATTTAESDIYYTLQGQPLPSKPTKSGIYIHNHQTVIVK